jgi:eukaryotic-like serine/threonine-protein kinase
MGDRDAGRPSDADTLPISPSEEAGTRLFDHRYLLEALVGTGGTGRVYRARDLELDEPVAVKILTNARAQAVQLLRREVRLARRVSHPNVVRVHDLGLAGGEVVYLTMELVAGPSLAALLARERLETGEAADIGRQICHGLDAAHRAGVLHVDLKPANVLIREDGPRRALISDFGIARALGDSQQAGYVIGTPMYMPPEQRRGDPLDPRSDVFAAAILLYELFSSELLFPTLEQAMRVDFSVARVRRDVPAPVADLVIRALDPRPDRRPPSAAILAAALGEVIQPSAASVPARPPLLAVVPFGDLGGGDGVLGVGIAEELIRILSTIRGVRVFAGGATARPSTDPRALGVELGADAVVRGTMQRAGERVRLNVSLLDVASGLQLWGDRFDGAIDEVISFQEGMALRICEALRVRWIALSRTGDAPAEAIDLYLRARRQMRHHVLGGPEGAVALLERCLALAPDLEPAVAMYAFACCRGWFLPSLVGERDWEEVSRRAVDSALARAPGLAESHLAAGMVAAQHGDIAGAAGALARALELAPTAADAHEYLGRLQAEAGHTDAALEHLRLAGTLDPSLHFGAIYLARYHLLRGDRSHASRLEAVRGPAALGCRQLLMRVATWYGDREELARHAEALPRDHLPREAAFLSLFAHYVLGGIDPAGLDQMFAAQLGRLRLSPRVMSNLHQMMVEAHAARGEDERALAHLSAAAGAALIDVDWLTACPLLERLRPSAAFDDALSRARARAAPLWRV